MTLRFN